MSVLVNGSMRVLIQGITGKQGQYHAERMLEYSMPVVAGTTPGRGGEEVAGVPVFHSVAEAVQAVGPIDASMILVPPMGVLEAGMEAVAARIPLIVIITEHVPTWDAVRLVAEARRAGVTLIGPNTIGVISPGKGKVGIMPGSIYSPGPVGIASRSGTLTHETASNLTFHGIGQSTCIGIGGDAVIGFGFVDALEAFRNDPETECVVLIGEIGGTQEQKAAEYLIRHGYPKPVLGFIGGRTAPPERRMGHAGAIVEGRDGTAAAKVRVLEEAGVEVCSTMDELLAAIETALKPAGGSNAHSPVAS